MGANWLSKQIRINVFVCKGRRNANKLMVFLQVKLITCLLLIDFCRLINCYFISRFFLTFLPAMDLLNANICTHTTYMCFSSIFIQNMVEAKLTNYAYGIGIDKRK